MKVVFFGTPEFAVPALGALLANKRFDVVGVVTQPDRANGRKKTVTPSPVKTLAAERGLKVLQPEKLKDEAIARVLELKPELSIVVAYGNLIPKRLIDALPRGSVNIHPSLLPKHRGASPLTATIIEGDKETGICLMVVDEDMDHGPVIACRKVSLNGDETTESLRKMLMPISADMINIELIEYLDGKITPVPQDHDKATFCKMIESANARLDWKKPIEEIERQVRALNGVTPAWTTLDDKMLLIHRARILKQAPSEGAGTLTEEGNGLAIACFDGYLLVDELQLSGGKPMSGRAFLNGHKDAVGKRMR